MLLLVVVDEIAFQRREEFSTQCFVNSLQNAVTFPGGQNYYVKRITHLRPYHFSVKEKKSEWQRRERELSPFMSSLRKMIVV